MSEIDSDARAAFLKAAQSGDVGALEELLGDHPGLLEARSTSKGYTAMHYAAMAGSIAAVEWLAKQGLAPDVDSSVPPVVTPLQVALEYRRLSTVRKLQQIRDAKARRLEEEAEAAAAAEAEAEAAAEHAAAKAAAEAGARRPRRRRACAEAEAARRAETAASDLKVANREAAQQALRGERALDAGDLQRAVRLLQKANNLQPDDAEIMAVKARADKEMAAVLREAREERDERRACRWRRLPPPLLPPPAPAPTRPRTAPTRPTAAAARASGRLARRVVAAAAAAAAAARGGDDRRHVQRRRPPRRRVPPRLARRVGASRALAQPRC